MARELAEQKEVIREKLVEKHSKHLKEEAVKQAKIAAGEKDIKNELFADALTAINGPSEVAALLQIRSDQGAVKIIRRMQVKMRMSQ